MKNLRDYIIIFGMMTTHMACNQDYNSQYAQNTQGEAKPVNVQSLEMSNLPIPIEASGILGSDAEVNKSFKTSGIVQKIYVKEGQFVRKGQVLASLNMVEINAMVRQAENAVKKAGRDLERAKNLHKENVITLEQLQDLNTINDVAKADLEIAQFNQRFSKIIATENCKILKRFAEEGELVNAGSPIFTIGSTSNDAYVMRIGVADKDIVRLQYRDSARISFDAYDGMEFQAYVSELAESADPKTGAFEVELTMKASQLPFKNGFVGKVKIFPSNEKPYYRISMNALVSGEKETAQVFLIDEKSLKAKKVSVKPKHIGEDYFTVLASDFQKGQIITEGASYLNDGDLVKIITPFNSKK